MRLAVMRYVMTGQVKEISAALNMQFVRIIEPTLDPTIFVSPDAFRRNVCYRPEVNAMFDKHAGSLRLIFNAMARVSTTPGAKKLGLLLGLAEWKTLIRRLHLIDVDLTERDSTLCFVTSRMYVIDGSTDKGRVKESNIPFEGFLECLCRAAILKGYPTDEEIRHSEFADGGSYILYLRKEMPANYKRIMEEEAAPWGSPPKLPAERCLEHLLTLIIRTIEAQASATTVGNDLQLSAVEMKTWSNMYKEVKVGERMR